MGSGAGAPQAEPPSLAPASGSPAAALPAPSHTAPARPLPAPACPRTSAAWGRSASSVPPVSRPSSAPRWLPRQVGASPPTLRAVGSPASRQTWQRLWLQLRMAPGDSGTESWPLHHLLPSRTTSLPRLGPLQVLSPGCLVWHRPALVLCWDRGCSGAGGGGGCEDAHHSVWLWHVLLQPLTLLPLWQLCVAAKAARVALSKPESMQESPVLAAVGMLQWAGCLRELLLPYVGSCPSVAPELAVPWGCQVSSSQPCAPAAAEAEGQ